MPINNKKNKKVLTKAVAAITASAFLLSLSGCSSTGGKGDAKNILEDGVFAMDTYMSFQVYADDDSQIIEKLSDEALRLDALLSTTNENSEVYKLNSSQGSFVTTDPEVAELIALCKEYSEMTDGCFNFTLYPLSAAWGFMSDERHVPEQSEIDTLLQNTDWTLVEVKDDTVYIPTGMEIDLGGIAKGYYMSRCTKILEEEGIESALLNLGGSIYAIGQKEDGNSWRVGIELPFSESDGDVSLACYLTLQDESVTTSGTYQRYFEEDGKIYHHVLDPSTGYPAQSGLSSVSIVTRDGAEGDALSTAYLVMGLEKGIEEWKGTEDIGVVWITDDNIIYYTENLSEIFTPADGMEAHVVSR